MARAKTWEEYKKECEAVAKEGITILGFVEPWKGNRTKLVCNCKIHGRWSTIKINRVRSLGVLPCPICSQEGRFNKLRLDLNIVTKDLKNLCKSTGYKFLEIIGEYKSVNINKLSYRCDKHGVKFTLIKDFKRGVRCYNCQYENLKITKRVDDDIHIRDFMRTGKFLEGTIFKRSNRKTKSGHSPYWYYTCSHCSKDEYVRAGLCSGIFESDSHRLKRGQLSCRCIPNFRYTKEQWEYRIKKECKKRQYKFLKWESIRYGAECKFLYLCPLHGEKKTNPHKLLSGMGCNQCAGHSQQECYINIIYDENTPVGIKFGISVNTMTRLKNQNRHNLFQMENIKIYNFYDVKSCKKAERSCLKQLECGIFTDRELKDGYTETTYLSNLEAIEEIFRKCGGTLRDN